jgi:4-aminobutyrate aminotransferase-like enzyme
MLLTTGAEAVESAVKIARCATGRPAIIAITGSFHGRTLMGMTLTGKVSPYRWHVPPRTRCSTSSKMDTSSRAQIT